jgi:pyrroloquinoline quinone (PQQ) biosynthesis protein C
MTEFTKEQLLEIEKIFDMYAGQNLNAFSKVVESLMQLGVKPDSVIAKKVLDQMQSANDCYRTISAVAHELWSRP